MNTLFELLKKAADTSPNKCAIKHGQTSVSYQDYLNLSSVIANYLEEKNLDLTKPILVLISDSPFDLFTFMGIAAIGGFYVPIAHGTAKSRVINILENYDFAAIISTQENENEIENCIYIHKILNDTTLKEKNLYYKGDVLQSSPVFGLFTSGSTGIPKLVLKSHQSIVNMCESFNKEFGFNEKDIFGNQVSFEFDSSCKSIFLALYNRATICLISPKDFMFPKKVIDIINEYKANTLIWSTFALRILANFKAFNYAKIPSVTRVMVSGESIPENAISYWIEHIDARYYNLYAPTEYSFNCLYHEIEKEALSTIPLGREIAGSKVFIINSEENRLCEAEEEGEIYIKGLGLSIGYFKDSKKTSEHFVQNPLHNDYPDIVYKTGDYGLKSKEGVFYFRGRIDNQIKHQGYRIELGEIESVANGVLGVYISGAVFDFSRQMIKLFFEGEISEQELYKHLKEKLPLHLLPKVVMRLDKMPLNKNNKVDRQVLKNMCQE